MITLNNISKKYNEKNIVRNFNLKINKGEFISIVGESGSGKTTLLNIIGLLEKQTSGDIVVRGIKNPTSKELTKLQREFYGYVFQNYALIEEDSVQTNLKLALKYNQVIDKQAEINRALKLVGLEGYNKKKVFELSGGEQQRLALARIMLKKCEIILADEPTGNLDNKNRDIVFNILKDLNKQGKTIVIVTHDNYIANKCDKIIKL
ncbi:Lipoprotein-releasing system ATP-binding protein LolD [uncultured Clostridium sp.]|nr:Lipoprotein-releasing system ATP-binding protein LolD [uncultured Clostridium sp.]SCJ54443.1 Lipoprotein-releasing system ATP-binding protein LolD [uncultured Clostridium sp.]